VTILKKALGLALGAACFVAVAGSQSANAALVINSTIGGVPTGVNYVNFDNLALGSAGGISGGVAVSFLPDGQTVVGNLSGRYAAPFISNSNGSLFGDPTVSGQDTTRYLSTGIGKVTLDLPGLQTYFGLLWGSVDTYNKLEFFNGAISVGSITGSQVTPTATGNQGINGTFYVNILSDLQFNRVVASSTRYAFEFDNVSYSPSNPVPAPAVLSLLGLGLLGLGAAARRRKA